MLKRILNLIFALSLVAATSAHAEETPGLPAIEDVCKGENLGQQLRVEVDSSQLAILEYDRVSELLYFNVYKDIVLTPTFSLKTSSKGLAFSMPPAKAMEITRLYSMGVYRIELLFLPKKLKKSEGFCEIHKAHNVLNIKLLRISLLDGKGDVFQAIFTKRGKVLKAQEKHAVRNYQNKGEPSVIVEIRGESMTATKVEKLKKKIRAPLFRCYREALERNGRYQGSIIFRFEKGKVRAIHSNKNVIFGNCVTKSIEKNLPINFEKKITFKTIFRLERK